MAGNDRIANNTLDDFEDKNAINWKNLIVACSAITIFGLALGLSYPLLSLIMEARGISADVIGINSAMTPLGILLFSFVIPLLVRRYSTRKIAIYASLISSLLIISYKFFDSLNAWFVLRFLQGMSITVMFVLSEAWIVKFAGDKHRGKAVAIYISVLAASFGIGPAIISVIGIHGWAPFIIAGITLLFGALPLLWLQEDNSQYQQEEQASATAMLGFIFKAPLLIACVFVFAILDTATVSLLPVYGVQNGLTVSTSALLLTVFVIGNTVFQFPIGWLADTYSHRKIIFGCCVLTVLALFILPTVMNTPLMWLALAVAGTAGSGIYTVALTSFGRRFRGIELINGASCFAVTWGVGALLGAISSGKSMSLWGPHGLPYYLAVVYALLIIGLVIRASATMKKTPA